jgi:large repetitive protein
VSPGLAVAGDNTNDVLLTGTQVEINATLAAATGLVYHSTLDYHGLDTLTVTTSDLGHTGSPGAQSDIDTVNITVTAVADIANDTASFAEDAGAQNILVQANDSFENPAHAITATTNGSHGTVTVNNNGTPANTADDFVVYTQVADFNGTDSFTYTVTSGGATETGTVNVTITAVTDIADDTATTNEDTQANIAVQGNDTFENSGHAITGTTNGVHGTVTVNNNGTPGNTADDFVVYTPSADFNGTDGFTYTVSSGGVTETATVNVTIAAVTDIVNDNATVVQNSGANNLDLLANDTFENPGRSISAVGAAAHGTTSINNNGTPGNTADDFVVYAPTSGYSGPDTFTYTVTSSGTTETATVSVTVTPLSTSPTPGNDNITGTNGSDIIFALAGDDVVDGLGGADLLFGNEDDDTVLGGAGNDLVSGGQGDDSVCGGTDGDILFGNEGKDTIDGGDGTDLIFGGQDNDSIVGGSGNDTIWGNEGNDTLAGGAGADRFIYLLLEGNDQINGFTFGEGDRLDLEGQSYTVGTSGDGDVLLTLQRGGTVELNGIAPAGFSASFVV